MNWRASVGGRFMSRLRSAATSSTISGRPRLRAAAPNRHPLRSETSPKNKSNHLAVAANARFDPIGLQVFVVDLPAGALQGRNLTTTQASDDRVDIATRPIGKCHVQSSALLSVDLPCNLPIQKEPTGVLVRW